MVVHREGGGVAAPGVAVGVVEAPGVAVGVVAAGAVAARGVAAGGGVVQVAWTWTRLPTLAAFVACAALAVVVFASRPDRLQNRLLALLLAVEGVYMACGGALMYMTDDPRATWAFQALTIVLLLAMPGIYLLFLSTVEAPVTRPLSRPAARWALVALAVLPPLLWFAAPQQFLLEVVRGTTVPWGVRVGPGYDRLNDVFGATSLFGFVAAVSALRVSAVGSAARGKAKAYLVAFGVRDAGFALIAFWPLVGKEPGWFDPELWTAIGLVYAVVLAYGILRTQLFDIDLKLKWTLRRGTLVGAFVAVFVVAAAVAEQWLQRYGIWVGGVAVGLLLLALRPLERAADRLADKAMPRVEATPAYITFRKVAVYQATVEDLLAGGGIGVGERRTLEALRRKLGLSQQDCAAAERDALDAPAATPAAAPGLEAH